MADNVGYIAPEYALARSVDVWESTPRFGHGTKASKLASFNNEEQVDYAMGLVLFAAFMLTFFVFWTVTLIVFACMGQQVGFLSGHPFVEPVKYQNPKPFRRPRRVRITFLICGILVIVFSVLFVTEGLQNLEYTQSSLSESNDAVKQLVIDSESIAQNLITVGEQSIPIRDELVRRLGNFCPGNPELEMATGYDFDAMASEGITYLNILAGFVENEVVQLKQGLETVKDTTDEISRVLDTYDVSDPKAMIYIIPVVILSSFLIFGVILSWCNMSFHALQCMLRWVIFPLFAIAVIFGYVLVSFFGFISTANADFCSGGDPPSPDGTIFEILAEQGISNPNDLVYQAFVYYIGGCRNRFPFDFLTVYFDELNLAYNSTQAFATSVDAVGLNELEEMCSVDLDPVANILVEVNDNLKILIKSADLGLDLLSCESLNSIYANTFHQAACTESVTGLSWIFACLMVISVCGMVMLTLRAAVYDVIEVVDLSHLRFAHPHRDGADDDDCMDYDKSKDPDYDEPRHTMSHSQSRSHSRSYAEEGSVESDPQDQSSMPGYHGVDASVQMDDSHYDDDTFDPANSKWATFDRDQDESIHRVDK